MAQSSQSSAVLCGTWLEMPTTSPPLQYLQPTPKPFHSLLQPTQPSTTQHQKTHLLPHLSPNVRQPLLAIKAHGLDPPVPKHLEDLSVLCVPHISVRFLLPARAETEGGVPWPSSLKTSSRLSASFSFFPLRRFLPPCGAVGASGGGRGREGEGANGKEGDGWAWGLGQWLRCGQEE